MAVVQQAEKGSPDGGVSSSEYGSKVRATGPWLIAGSFRVLPATCHCRLLGSCLKWRHDTRRGVWAWSPKTALTGNAAESAAGGPEM